MSNVDRTPRVEELDAMARRAEGRGARNGKGSSGMGAVFNVFPLIVVPVLVYCLLVLFNSGDQNGLAAMEQLLRYQGPFGQSGLGMMSRFKIDGVEQGARWFLSWGDVLVLFALVLLFIELLKSTSTGTAAIFNHALSMVVFTMCLVMFIVSAPFSTSTFFIILTMSGLDVLAGLAVTIVSARRDVEFDKG